MNYKQPRARNRTRRLAQRLFEPGWSGRFGAAMLTAMVAAVLIVMGLGIA